ncbi:sugar ABC transporter substrate-binding protein [Lachnobacterium bovis]|uniref:Arabinogalactan oligomer / maltooligosaccharide transport system substrate-binding protein n=1 Tax=Lachnobacterium bovis TaxID=140626 RepID=A0A1H9PBR5_9FIRM|nr:extracellular solute-binding protein [Lachnobacterium bovis]SER45694.1 arabinogalactan oligomer / maltooligosaccharide transport system substrate-binding protein [Lachnobacterium bovis]
MKKKVVAIMLLSSMMLSLVGCSKDNAEANNKKTSGAAVFDGKLEKNVTIHVLENDTAIDKGYFKKLIDAFNKEYKSKGIKAVDANMDQYSDLTKDGPYGYGPDVIYQANDVIMKYVKGKHVLPLPVEEIEGYKEIPSSAWKAYETKMDGKTYTCGIPVNVQAPMLYYRKDLLPADWKEKWDDNKNNVPDMLETWQSMYKFSIQRHKEDASKYGYMKSISDMYFSSGFLFSYGGYVFGKNNTDPSDIGLNAKDSAKGASVLNQLASVMSEDCIDDTITTNAYSKLADGTYFATLSTPDMYSTFLSELEKSYTGISKNEAEKKAKENLVMTTLPTLPKSGDLTDNSKNEIPTKTMGGVNAYAISSYTKAPNASLLFVKFATKFKMLKTRADMLGIAPARKDVAKSVGGTSEKIYENLDKNNIVLMPSVTSVSQIWTPSQTFLIDIAKDPYRKDAEKKYKDINDYSKGLDEMCKQIDEAIKTLK